MELDLTLGGDCSRVQLGSLQDRPITQASSAFDPCMDLGHRFERAGESLVDEDDPALEGDGEAPVLQLGLLPRRSSPRRENGSWEYGSSGNKNPATAVAVEDASSANRSGGGGSTAVEGERGSDDDENANARKKLRLSKEQSAYLEESFKEHSTLNPKQKLALAAHLNLRPRQVEVWFQNRRARTKLRQTEVDCEYLKRCFDALTEENRRLQKEVQELRALKRAAPFYMQAPATTLTMCPSCERVAPSSSAAERDSRPRFFPAAPRNHAAAT